MNLNVIKNFFKKNSIEINNHLDTSFGDVLSVDNKNYSVLDNKKHLLCLDITTSVDDIEKMNNYYILSKTEYGLEDNLYINLENVIPLAEEKNINKLYSLSDRDKSLILKELRIRRITYEDSSCKLKLPFQIGDIITNNGFDFLIVNLKDDKMLCALVLDSIDDKITAKSIDFNNMFWLYVDGSSEFIDFVDDEELTKILKKEEMYILEKNNSKILKKGSVFFKNQKYYYIYGEDEEKLLAIEIKHKLIDSYDEIHIGDNVFYTDYTSHQEISKDIKDYAIVCTATIDEIDKIKNQKKEYINKEKVLTKKTY